MTRCLVNPDWCDVKFCKVTYWSCWFRWFSRHICGNGAA